MGDVVENNGTAYGQPGQNILQIETGTSLTMISIHGDYVEESSGILGKILRNTNATVALDEFQLSTEAKASQLLPNPLGTRIWHTGVRWQPQIKSNNVYIRPGGGDNS